jgi:hypothetical protein
MNTLKAIFPFRNSENAEKENPMFSTTWAKFVFHSAKKKIS